MKKSLKKQNGTSHQQLSEESPMSRFKMDNYIYLLKNRIININGPINDDIIELLVVQIFRMNHESKKPITILINSPGGSIDAMHAAIDTIMGSVAPVTTVALGCCMSAGLDIFLAGHKRLCLKNTLFVMHSGKSSVVEATLPSIVNEGTFLTRLMKRWSTYYESRTKKNAAFWNKILKSGKDYIYFSDEAIELGIATGYFKGAYHGK